MLFVRKTRKECFILLCGYFLYTYFIKDLSANFYYSITALLNLLIGLAVFRLNLLVSACSYSLVLVNVYGYWLWYSYQEPTLYDNISLTILTTQLALIVQKGLLDGIGNNSKHNVAEPFGAFGFQQNIKMRKNRKAKEDNQ
jgi:hypothetical protein